MSAAFWLTSLLVVLTPGTGVAICLCAGLRDGWRGALAAALGCTLGVVPHLLVALSGAAVLLRTDAAAFAVLKVLGVAYLLLMAWWVWRSDTRLTLDDAWSFGALRTTGTAVVANLLNPKLSVFFLAFLPQFVEPTDPGATRRMLLLGVAFMAMTLLAFLAYGAAAGVSRALLARRPGVARGVQRALAVGYVGFGVRLLVS